MLLLENNNISLIFKRTYFLKYLSSTIVYRNMTSTIAQPKTYTNALKPEILSQVTKALNIHPSLVKFATYSEFSGTQMLSISSSKWNENHYEKLYCLNLNTSRPTKSSPVQTELPLDIINLIHLHNPLASASPFSE